MTNNHAETIIIGRTTNRFATQNGKIFYLASYASERNDVTRQIKEKNGLLKFEIQTNLLKARAISQCTVYCNSSTGIDLIRNIPEQWPEMR